MYRVQTTVPVHNRRRIQQQPAALRQPLCFVTVRVIVRVCVCTEYTAVLMYDMHRLGIKSMLLAARLLVYRQLDRASSMQQTNISVNDLPPLAASSYSQHLSTSTGISIATALNRVHTSTSMYLTYVFARFLRAVLFILYIYQYWKLLQVSMVDVSCSPYR